MHEFYENRDFSKINASGPMHPTLPCGLSQVSFAELKREMQLDIDVSPPSSVIRDLTFITTEGGGRSKVGGKLSANLPKPQELP